MIKAKLMTICCIVSLASLVFVSLVSSELFIPSPRVSSILQEVENTVTYPYSVVAGYNMVPTPPSPATSPPGFAFTCNPSVANLGNLAELNSNMSVTLDITNQLSHAIYVTNLTAEVTAGTITDDFQFNSIWHRNFTLVSIDVFDDPWVARASAYDEVDYLTGTISGQLHRDGDTYYGTGGTAEPSTIVTGPAPLVGIDCLRDAAATHNVAPILLAPGETLTEYFAAKIWGSTTSGSQIDGTITLTLTYIVVQTSKAEWYTTGCMQGPAPDPSSPMDPADNVDYSFNPPNYKTEYNDYSEDGKMIAGENVRQFVDMNITNNLGYDIEVIDLLAEVTESTMSQPFIYFRTGHLYANVSLTYVDVLNPYFDEEVVGVYQADYDSHRKAWPGITGWENSEHEGTKYGPTSLRQLGGWYVGSMPDSQIVPPTLLPNGDLLQEKFLAGFWGNMTNGISFNGTLEFTLVYRPVVSGLAVLSVSSSFTDAYTTWPTQQVNVTVQNNVGSAITCRVASLLETYGINCIEMGAQSVSLAIGETKTLNFNWDLSTASVVPYYTAGVTPPGSVKGLAISNFTVTSDYVDAAIYGPVRVKMPGDVDGDCDVDSTDVFSYVALAYGKTPPDPAYNVQCDFDMDNDVDSTDVFSYLALNYGLLYFSR